jgi:hypothetical protein
VAKRKLWLLFSAREGSTRLPNKLTRRFHQRKTLFDLYCERYLHLCCDGRFAGGTMAVCPDDAGLLAAALSHGIKPLLRSPESIVKGAPLSTIFAFVKDIDASHFMWVNACHPMLCNDTLQAAASTFHKLDTIRSMTSVIAEASYFWDSAGVPVETTVDKGRELRTDTARMLFKGCHAFHIWPKDLVLSKGVPWEYSGPADPYLFEIWSYREAFDIEDEDSFNDGKALYAALQE